MKSMKTLQRTFVRDEAYVLLRDWIIKGKLVPSQRLRDKELAEKLGVSRTPIREALLKLEDEGFVQTKPNSSTIVSPIDTNIEHLYSIIWTLEGLALEQAFGNITPSDIERMVNFNEKMLKALKAQHPLGAVEADIDFHSVYIDLSNNEELKQIIQGIKQKLKRVDLHYFEKFKSGLQSYQEHKKIITALKKKDLKLSLKALLTNWKESFSRIDLSEDK